MVLPSSWVKPVVRSVILPAHAQTSGCDMIDLVGTWRFTSATHAVPALNPTFELFSDGSTSDLASTWSLNSAEFVLRQDVSDFVFTDPLARNFGCDILSGTSTTVFTETLPENGTWTAERVTT